MNTTQGESPEPNNSRGYRGKNNEFKKNPTARKKVFSETSLEKGPVTGKADAGISYWIRLRCRLNSHKPHATRGGVINDDFKFTIVIRVGFHLLHYSASCARILWGRRGFVYTSLRWHLDVLSSWSYDGFDKTSNKNIQMSPKRLLQQHLGKTFVLPKWIFNPRLLL